MATIETRLAALERRWPPVVAAPIFFVPYDTIASGFAMLFDNTVFVLRSAGETDDALRARAYAAAEQAHPGARHFFRQVDDDPTA